MAARSPVFTKMIKQETELMKIWNGADGAPVVVRMYDIDKPTLRALLLFIYTGKVNTYDNGLVVELATLKTVCEDVRIRKVNKYNVGESLDAATKFYYSERAVKQEIKGLEKSVNYSGSLVVTVAPNCLTSDGGNFWDCY